MLKLLSFLEFAGKTATLVSGNAFEGQHVEENFTDFPPFTFPAEKNQGRQLERLEVGQAAQSSPADKRNFCLKARSGVASGKKLSARF
ncbi:MAG: hypothetical protein IPN95_20575 [Bacteroidetes bacterium]|nr:hypothetical protein [Bacteroidota bacterium]MBL0018315.1 hypothetical protein [Bacteroidota bacterium]MBP6722433.1 hypothetical protein [Bacteroidia bacterium]